MNSKKKLYICDVMFFLTLHLFKKFISAYRSCYLFILLINFNQLINS